MRRIVLSLLMVAGALGMSGLLSTAAHAAPAAAVKTVPPPRPPPPTNPCQTYPYIYNSFLYVTGDTTWPWYGANGNYTYYPITENQTPAGQPGHGDGPYQNFTLCLLSGTVTTSGEIEIYSTAVNTWVAADTTVGTLFADATGVEQYTFTCYTGDIVRLEASSLGVREADFETGLYALSYGYSISDPLLMGGLCGEPAS